jgi:hypothetical protein
MKFQNRRILRFLSRATQPKNVAWRERSFLELISQSSATPHGREVQTVESLAPSLSPSLSLSRSLSLSLSLSLSRALSLSLSRSLSPPPSQLNACSYISGNIRTSFERPHQCPSPRCVHGQAAPVLCSFKIQ